MKKFRWHARRKEDDQCCWLVQGLDNFDKTPFVETRGRQPLVMPQDMRKARLRLLQRHARVMQVIKAESEREGVDVDRLIRLGSQLAEMKEQISLAGGVPKSWG